MKKKIYCATSSFAGKDWVYCLTEGKNWIKEGESANPIEISKTLEYVGPYRWYKEDDKNTIYFRYDENIQSINDCDVVFCFLKDDTNYQTIWEIGYAIGCGKEIVLSKIEDLPQFNFLYRKIGNRGYVFNPDVRAEDNDGKPGLAIKTLVSFVKNGFRTDRKKDYQKYLKSQHWLEFRETALDNAGRKCQVCGATESLDVHHNNYDNLGNETLTDVVVLCRKHHAMFHGKIKAEDE